MYTTNIIRLTEMIWEDCNIIIYTEYLGLFEESRLPSGNSRNTKTHADRSLMDKKKTQVSKAENSTESWTISYRKTLIFSKQLSYEMLVARAYVHRF